MAIVWLVLLAVVWLRFARRPRPFAGFATGGHAHIRGLAQDLLSSYLRRLSRARPPGGGCSGDESRSAVREPGWPGPPRGPQREWQILGGVVSVSC